MNLDILKQYEINQFNQVFIDDEYRLKTLKKIPATVYDLGACIGCFTCHVKKLFPNTNVVAMEPNSINFEVLRKSTFGEQNITLLNAAIGKGTIFEAIGKNVGHHHYMSVCVGYPRPSEHDRVKETNLRGFSIPELLKEYPPNGDFIVKIDCEGGENSIYEDKEAFEVLKNALFITGELHFYVQDQTCKEDVDKTLLLWLHRFGDTHKVYIELHGCNSGHFWIYRNDIVKGSIISDIIRI